MDKYREAKLPMKFIEKNEFVATESGTDAIWVA
jgi:hypothetical protein